MCVFVVGYNDGFLHPTCPRQNKRAELLKLQACVFVSVLADSKSSDDLEINVMPEGDN